MDIYKNKRGYTFKTNIETNGNIAVSVSKKYDQEGEIVKVSGHVIDGDTLVKKKLKLFGAFDVFKYYQFNNNLLIREDLKVVSVCFFEKLLYGRIGYARRLS